MIELGRIDPPRMEGMTLADANHSSQATTKHAMFVDRPNTVFATGRLKATSGTQKGADDSLIAPHRCYQQGGRNLEYPTANIFRRTVFHESPLPSRTAMLAVSSRRLLTTDACWGIARCRGITIQSTPPGISVRCVLNASRIALFHRFRQTLGPTFLDTDSPILA